MKKLVILVVLLVVLAVAGAVSAAGSVSHSFSLPNSLTVNVDADGPVHVDWGDGSSVDLPTGVNAPNHTYAWDPVPGGYSVTVVVTGAVSANITVRPCWVECERSSAGHEENQQEAAPASPRTYCVVENPGGVVPNGQWHVEFSTEFPLFVKDGSVEYLFNAHNHKDQVWDGLAATSRRVIDQDGNHVGNLWVVNHRYPNPWWRCGADFFGQHQVGRPLISPANLGQVSQAEQMLS